MFGGIHTWISCAFNFFPKRTMPLKADTVVSEPTEPMKVTDIARRILTMLCENAGKMSERHLTDLIVGEGLLKGFSTSKQETTVTRVLRDMEGFLFKLETEGGVTQIYSYTPLELCPEYCTKAGCRVAACGKLHLCKFFVFGSCRFGANCMFGHDLHTLHNRALLSVHFLDKLKDEHIRFMLSQTRTNASVPLTCKYYNVEGGCRTGADGAKCPWLHVCKHHVMGLCAFGTNCRRSHDIFGVQPKSILEKYGINVKRAPTEVLEELRKKYRRIMNIDAPTAPTLVSDGSTVSSTKTARPAEPSILPAIHTNEICTSAIQGKCSSSRNCNKHHREYPYQWEYCLTGSQKWFSLFLKCNQKIERTYSDPFSENAKVLVTKEDGRKVDMSINFETMDGTVDGMNCRFRRLSTVSSVEAAPTHPYTTNWQWYWRDNDGSWKTYGAEGSQKTRGIYKDLPISSDISSREIEEAYLQYDASAPTEILFSTLTHSYVLDLGALVQKNEVYGTERPVRRRPEFYTKTANSSALNSMDEASSVLLTMIKPPKHWEINYNFERDSFRLFEVRPTSAEYIKIKNLVVQEPLEKLLHPIKSIKRIQNYELWERYCRNKTWKKKKGGEEQDERFMFHGTDKKFVEAICQQGFDWRLSGSSVGTVYGKGSYFAYHARVALPYTLTNTLFVVKVLVGKSGLGKSSYVKPPPLDPNKPLGPLYDTCVDRLKDPRMVIVFEQERSYPEYIIEFDFKRN